MKTVLVAVAILALNGVSSDAGHPPTKERRIQDINAIPTRVLRRMISPKFYDTLLVSPIKGWVAVRGELVGTKVFGARIARSELNGKYDALALERMKGIKIQGNFTTGSNTRKNVLLHLLVYDTADGTMALSFATLEGPGSDQLLYWGCTKLEILKQDGRWVEVQGPEGLQGKGMVVQSADFDQNIGAILKLDAITEKP
ncbi:MAG: hypothetical protein ACR2NX_00175 [Chthoniobacterales bacterium]